LLGLLDTVAEGAPVGGLHNLGVGRVEGDVCDLGTGVGRVEKPHVFGEEVGDRFVVVLAEEVGFADGFVGEMGVEREQRRGQEES